MKQRYLKFIGIIILFFALSIPVFSQNGQSIWSKTLQQKVSNTKITLRSNTPKKALFYNLDITRLKNLLKMAPKSSTDNSTSSVIISFPNSDGTFEDFRIKESSILHPDLQAEMKNSRTYVGESIKNPNTLISFSLTSRGLHTMTLSSDKGSQFIDPYTRDGLNYMVYKKKDLSALKENFTCHVTDGLNSKSNTVSKNAQKLNDGLLRTYRLAIACTIEYAAFHVDAAGMGGASGAMKKDVVMDAMIVTMNRVNSIFKRDLSVTMEFIANNKEIIFINSDSFTNDNANALINESQSQINSIIMPANYDIGHTFSTGAGGLAGLGVVCENNEKAKGVTGSPSPVGDAYDIDFVAHEIGHQFGAPHTFNGNAGNCDASNRTASNAYEPGSGTTIMAYAGICAPQNVQGNGDAYFHQKSLQVIWSYITTSATCAAQTSTGNSAPVAEAGSSFTIPSSTPYKITGSSTDPDDPSGNPASHTYTWEQYDLGPTGLPADGNLTGPMVRSYEGTTNKTRYIPQLEDLRYSGGSTTWEKLASVGRDLTFQLTVRDNASAGGRTATDNMIVTTVDGTGPFILTSQSTSNISWVQNSTETVTWNIAGTTGNGINTNFVNILLSTDGGLTFPTVLASNVGNDGSQDITVPNITETNCRVMVEAVNNIFFAINTEDFSIGYSVTTTCNQYSGGSGLPLSIPDNGTAFETSTINVTESTTISDINVGLNITHTYNGDLQIVLISPNSTQINLITPNTCGDGNLIVKLDDQSIPFDCDNAGSNQTYQTISDPLSSFNGENSSGNWTLGVVDLVTDDMGTLNSWYVEVCTTTETLLSIDDFNDLANLKVFPNPNKGEFTLNFNSNSSKDIKLEVYDISGRVVYNKVYGKTSLFDQIIRLNSIQSGMYILKVNDGIRKSTKKIIVE